MEILFATQNAHKVEEIQIQLNEFFQLKSLLDIKYLEELEETQITLEGNALQKARFVHSKFELNCFADDTGLEVEALNGEPGVLSARYAGPSKSFDDNMNKLLHELGENKNRKAKFRTVIALILNNKEYLFEGICKGEITERKMGNKGFGYDPIFMPEGFDKTFAELSIQEKSKIGHRGIAVSKLVDFLKTENQF